MNRVIKELFGEERFNKTKEKICKTSYKDWFDFEEAIESFKKKFINLEQLEEYYTIDCDIFRDNYNEEEWEKLNRMIQLVFFD